MIPLTLKMRNFLSYRGDTPLFDFRVLHIACISGENGAGKSSFLEAIHWALWGKARVDESAELICRGESAMMVELVFEVNNIVYRVTRSFSNEKRAGSKLDLAQASDATLTSWSVLNGSSISETQQKITRDIIGMSYHIFQNSAYLRQGKADAFVQLTSTERREVIAEILEITKYDAYQQEAKRRRDQFNSVIEMLRGAIGEDERQALEIPEHQSTLQLQEQHLAKAKAYRRYVDALEEYQQIQQYLGELDRQLRERNARRDEHLRTLDTYTTQLAQRPHVEAEHAKFIIQRETVHHLEHLRTQVIPLIRERQSLTDELRDIRSATEIKIAQLRAKIETFDTLNIQLTNAQTQLDALTNELIESADNVDILDTLLQEFSTQQQHVTTLQRTLQELQHDDIELSRLTQRINQLELDVADYDRIVTQLEAATDAQERINELDRRLSSYYAQDRGYDKDLDSLTHNADKLKKRRDTIQAGEPCPTCQTVMDDAHLTHAYSTFEQQLDEWRTAYRDVQAQQKALKSQIAQAEAEKPQLAQLVSQITTLRKHQSTLDTQKQRLDEAQQAANQLHVRLAQHDIEQVTAHIESTHQHIAKLDNQIQQLRAQVAVRQTKQHQVDDLRSQIAQISEQIAEQETLTNQLDHLTVALANNSVGAEIIERITQIDTQIDALNFDEQMLDDAKQALAAFGDIQTTFTQLQSLESTHSILKTTINDINNDIARISEDIERRQHEQQRIKKHIDADASMFAPVDRSISIQQLQKQAEGTVSSISDIVSRLQERLENAKKAELRLEENRRKLLAEEQQRQRFETLSQAFSNRGIQAMLINEYALPALELEANRLLARMTDNQLYLSFKTSHITKQGRAQEVLEIEVSDTVGTRPLEAFSGGESFRISFALRIALSKLLAHRAGHRLETLIIDEGFGTQDAQGRERLVEAINSISDEFRTILVITHVSEVRDMFPTQILIRRTSQTSQWEVIS